jgi:hypothetical protein
VGSSCAPGHTTGGIGGNPGGVVGEMVVTACVQIPLQRGGKVGGLPLIPPADTPITTGSVRTTMRQLRREDEK